MDWLPPSQAWLRDLIAFTPDVSTSIYCEQILPRAPTPPGPVYLISKLAERKNALLERRTAGIQRLVDRAVYRSLRLAESARVDRLVAKLKAQQTDVLHVHFGDFARAHLRLIRRAGIPCAVSFYGHDYGMATETHGIRQGRRSTLTSHPAYHGLWASGAHFLAEGPYGRATLIALGAPVDGVSVQPLGIEPPRVAVPSPAAADRFVQLAHVEPKKGQRDTLAAFSYALREHPDATLTFIGGVRDEAYDRALRADTTALGLCDRVHRRPPVPSEALVEVLRGYGTFVQPSRYAEDGNNEGGAPVSLLWAQAAGLQIVCTDHCDLPFLVSEAARVVPVGDSRALALAMMSAARAAEPERTEATRRGSRHVSQAFDVRRLAEDLRAFYERIAG